MIAFTILGYLLFLRWCYLLGEMLGEAVDYAPVIFSLPLMWWQLRNTEMQAWDVIVMVDQIREKK